MSTDNDAAAQIAHRLATAQTADLDAAIDEVLAIVGHETNSDRTYLTRFHRDDTIEVQHEWLDPRLAPHRVALGVAPAARFPYSIDLALAGKRCEIGDIDDLPPAAETERQSFTAFGVKAILQIPVIVDDAVVGVLGLNSQSARDWSTLDDDFVDWAAQALGVAMVRQSAAAEIKAATADAERSRQAAHHLLARFSHELRTPLHVILGYTELLQLKANDPDDTDALAHISFNGRRLLALIEDLMKFDDDGDDEIGLVPLGEVLDEVIEAISAVAARRELTIDVDIDDGLALWFDRGRLRQVLYCQLAATVQNTPPGSRVHYSTADDGEQAEVMMRVTNDDGEALAVVAMPLAEALLEDETDLVVESLNVDGTPTEGWTARFALRSIAPD